MFKGSSLSEEQREAAVALFATGWGSMAVACKLGVGRKAVLRLHDSGIVGLFPLGAGRAFA
jgi:transposase